MSDTKRPAAPVTPASPREERVFMEADGVRWRVYEQPFADYDRRQGMSLIFTSDGAVRRVRNYPSDWATLSDLELAGLSWKP